MLRLLSCALGIGAASALRAPLGAARMMATVSQPDVSRYVTQPRPDATKDYIMQQTMIRVKDPEASL